MKSVKLLLIVAALLFVTLLYYVSGRSEEEVDESVTEDTLDIIDVGEARLEDDIRAQVLKERAQINERQSIQEKKLRKQEEEIRVQTEEIRRQEAEVAAMRSALDMLVENGMDQTGVRLPGRAESEDSEITGDGVHAPSFGGGIGRLTVSRDRVPASKKKTAEILSPRKLHASAGSYWLAGEDGR